jgi:hypothetical protein
MSRQGTIETKSLQPILPEIYKKRSSYLPERAQDSEMQKGIPQEHL